MTQSGQGYHHGIAFVGDYLPRNCGIATFTHDLAEAVARQTGRNQPVIVVAMNDTPKGYAYPDRVKFEVRQDYQIDYSRAADFLNFSRIDVVCLQHEYGIFGGDWGSNLLTLLRDLHRPFIVTCHTVFRDTQPVQKEVFEEIAARAAYLIVMSDLAVSMLQDIYKVPSEKIMLIPHGIHDVPFIDPSFYKDKFGVEGRDVLLTFGLLHRKKGIEYMIEALPAIAERHPKVTYLVLGATHPHVVKQEGESYRLSLQRRVRELGLEDHMLFHPRFVELDELLEYLGATDICVTPYLNLEQITSGALAYAMGSGKAVVSTPYGHAKELLSDGRGRLVPLRDSEALSREINALLDDEVVMSSVRKKAYMHTRGTVLEKTMSASSTKYEATCRAPFRRRLRFANRCHRRIYRRPASTTSYSCATIRAPRITLATPYPTGATATVLTTPLPHSWQARSSTTSSATATPRVSPAFAWVSCSSSSAAVASLRTA
jgi:glycosyltransferase involved in cell wall biosynthesis